MNRRTLAPLSRTRRIQPRSRLTDHYRLRNRPLFQQGSEYECKLNAGDRALYFRNICLFHQLLEWHAAITGIVTNRDVPVQYRGLISLQTMPNRSKLVECLWTLSIFSRFAYTVVRCGFRVYNYIYLSIISIFPLDREALRKPAEDGTRCFKYHFWHRFWNEVERYHRSSEPSPPPLLENHTC